MIVVLTGGTGGAAFRPGDAPRQRSLLLFAEGDMVYALEGGPVALRPTSQQDRRSAAAAGRGRRRLP